MAVEIMRKVKIMKSTCIIARIDDLGRVIIPKTIREKILINPGDDLEIFIEESTGSVIFRRYETAFETALGGGKTMDEYIEREMVVSIIEAKQKELCPAGKYGRNYVYGAEREEFDNWEEIIDAFCGIPAADVAPVRHGRWIEDDDGYGQHCSECGMDYYVEKYRYCPNCGAKMESP